MRIFIIAFLLLSTQALFAQRNSVSRITGEPVPCSQIGCDTTDLTYENTDRHCLNCLMRLADSAMKAEVDIILQQCKTQGRSCSKFLKEQKAWERKCEKKATKESNKYKGGRMETTEYVRAKLIETNGRTIYLRRYLNDLAS